MFIKSTSFSTSVSVGLPVLPLSCYQSLDNSVGATLIGPCQSSCPDSHLFINKITSLFFRRCGGPKPLLLVFPSWTHSLCGSLLQGLCPQRLDPLVHLLSDLLQ